MIYVLALSVFLLAVALTGITRRYALVNDLLDRPNLRSSHAVATPRGGGLAIAAASMFGFLALSIDDSLSSWTAAALIGGGLTIAAVGFIDDRRGLSPAVRVAAHVCAAVWAVYCIGGLSPFEAEVSAFRVELLKSVVIVLGIVWTLNFFNFMDGIDGIAASEASFFGLAFGALSFLMGSSSGIGQASILFACACAGFLVWNWPPAKIFMGDAGSGYIGYVIAVLGLAAMQEQPNAAFVWLLLVGAFLVDATLTLTVRFLRNERIYEPHRSHAYQRLSRRFASHRNVTVALLALNMTWFLPLAILAALRPAAAPWVTIGGLIPIAVIVYRLGAGRADSLG